jgi:hypothetical protein
MWCFACFTHRQGGSSSARTTSPFPVVAAATSWEQGCLPGTKLYDGQNWVVFTERAGKALNAARLHPGEATPGEQAAHARKCLVARSSSALPGVLPFAGQGCWPAATRWFAWAAGSRLEGRPSTPGKKGVMARFWGSAFFPARRQRYVQRHSPPYKVVVSHTRWLFGGRECGKELAKDGQTTVCSSWDKGFALLGTKGLLFLGQRVCCSFGTKVVRFALP